MRTKRPRRLTPLALSFALAVTATLAAGCSKDDGDDAAAQATVPTAPSTTPTTAPADPYAVPDDVAKIDADYVNRVLAALNHIRGDLARAEVANGGVRPTDLVGLRAMYNEPEFSLQARIFTTTAMPPLDQIRQPVGDVKMTVDHFMTVRVDCVSAVVLYDFSDVLVNPRPARSWYVAIAPKEPGADPQHLNSTPWAFSYDGSDEVDQCSS